MTTNLEQYKVDHLILLVGGNPLPNAIAALCLVKSDGKVTLLHSKGTESVADRLREIIAPPEKEIKLIPVKEADRVSIEKGIEKALEKETGTIGLNYTGGTKAMSVHAVRIVEKRAEKRKAVFSYLDSRTLSLRIDPYENGRYPVNSIVEPIGYVSFSLCKMLALHNWQLKENEPPRKEPLLPKTTQAIALINSKQGYKEWKTWKDRFVKEAKIGNNGWKQVAIELPTSIENLKPFVDALQSELAIDTNNMLDIKQACQKCNVDTKVFCEWMESKWLEVLSLQAFLDCPQEFELHNIFQSYKPQLKDNPKVNFELDCIAMKGYQLFAVSCTTDPNNVATDHLLEVYMRSTQIGGDEARMALVCTTDDPMFMRDKIRRNLDSGDRVLVFGKEDLPHLKERFHKWITEASKGEAD